MALKATWMTPAGEQVGNSLGYNTHRKFMRKYTEPYFDYVDDAEVCVHIVPADIYTHVPGKFNVLFTMWETSEIPTKYIKSLNQADLIVVPSNFCKEVFKKYTTRPIEVCFEGVESESFQFYQRIPPLFSQPFRILWVGAPNPRKGYPSVLQVAKMVEQTPDLELYIKTTIGKFDRKEYVSDLWKKRREIRRLNNTGALSDDLSVKKLLSRGHIRHSKLLDGGEIKTFGKYENVIFDNRKVSPDELVSLYNRAHLFLLPTMGEGWGLTLCEAMATGCPCIATAVTGCADFFDDDVGYPLKFDVVEAYLDYYDVRACTFAPDTMDLVNKVIYVYHSYHKALAKGKRASERIHKRFTWEIAGKRFSEIVEQHYNQKGGSDDGAKTPTLAGASN